MRKGEIVDANTPLAFALFEAIKAACALPDDEERRALIKELTTSLTLFNNPLVTLREST